MNIFVAATDYGTLKWKSRRLKRRLSAECPIVNLNAKFRMEVFCFFQMPLSIAVIQIFLLKFDGQWILDGRQVQISIAAKIVLNYLIFDSKTGPENAQRTSRT